MKKIKILLLATFVVAGMQSAYSQAELALGVKGGLNFANLNASSVGAAYNSRTGYHAGAFLLVKLAKFGIQPEVIFSQQGTTVKVSTTNLDQNFSYVNIPIIAKLYL